MPNLEMKSRECAALYHLLILVQFKYVQLSKVFNTVKKDNLANASLNCD